MLKAEALQKLNEARDLLDKAEGLVSEVKAACEEAGVSCNTVNFDIFGIVRDDIAVAESDASQLP